MNLDRTSKYNKSPYIEIKNGSYQVINGWDNIVHKLNSEINSISQEKKIIVIETYQGVIHEELISNFKTNLQYNKFIHAEDFMLQETEIENLVFPNVTNDRIFGFLTSFSVAKSRISVPMNMRTVAPKA